MAKKTLDSAKTTALIIEVDPSECPFREFRDNELQPEFWGLSPAAFRAMAVQNKGGMKQQGDQLWIDDQTQPLPRSVRQYLHGWIRAEDLALSRWEAETVIFEENNIGKMSIIDIQLSHTQVLLRSSFCRKVLSACFLLETVEPFVVEHQWECFSMSIAPEGWRPRFHIYSPGIKPGGGLQHRPGLSKNGCYLVRLYYLGAWRCVWVNDQVPVDATDSPLLPFSPLLTNVPTAATLKSAKQVVTTVTSSVIHLWPLLLCKALLKLAAPDMNSDEDQESFEDEPLSDFSILHCLTGSMCLLYEMFDPEELWQRIKAEVPTFCWDDDDDTLTSTVKSKGNKKPTAKETAQRSSMATLIITDTKNQPPYVLPGITPAYELDLLVSMVRDLPLKKPLPEPDVPLWKNYRWVDWARSHGLYEAYDCPRTRFLKVNGLLKLSYAPHLLDVQSNESITATFREEHDRTTPTTKKAKEITRSTTANVVNPQMKEELREWILYASIFKLIKTLAVVYYPSLYQYALAGSSPPLRITKGNAKILETTASKCAPLYLQIDGPDDNVLKLSLSALHPRILLNSGVPMLDHVEPAHLVLEEFKWFENSEIPIAKAYMHTRDYKSLEVTFRPGRHICRIWVHSRTNWHVTAVSESSVLLGRRDLINGAAVVECPWASRFLSFLGAAFISWIKINRSNTDVIALDREFYRSYQPDLAWDVEQVGYEKSFLHWMFRKTLQSILSKTLNGHEYRNACEYLRRYFCDPDFGLPPKPKAQRSLRGIAALDPCDCLMPEAEENDVDEEIPGEQVFEEKPLVNKEMMAQLLKPPVAPTTSQVCELATEELSCGLLKEEREKEIKKHEAATLLQAHWRGHWARKCLNSRVILTPDILKSIMDNAFGNLEALSALMNEFFEMFPTTMPAYSLSSALTGTYGLRQFAGSTPVTAKCKWIPYFQAVFYCHTPVKVHFDVQSSLQYSTMGVYDNDTGKPMPQVHNAHITFDFSPNFRGYTVMGHGTLEQPVGYHTEASWQLTVLSSVNDAFHVCDNDCEGCKEIPLAHSTKMRIEEIFIPNRRKILGGIQISVVKDETISFRAAATSPDLEIEAVLRTTTGNVVTEISRCSGKGEVHWPYIKLQASQVRSVPYFVKNASVSQSNLAPGSKDGNLSTRSLRVSKPSKLPMVGKKSNTKLKMMPHEPKIFSIEVTAPQGWPLTVDQWKRVDEIRNSCDFIKIDTMQHKKPVKDKPSSAKEKEKDKNPPPSLHQPQIDDAYTVIECSLAIGGGAFARRDDERDLELAAAIRSWDLREPGRNARGAQIRKSFRTEFLESVPVPPSESAQTIVEEYIAEEFNEEDKKMQSPQTQQGPSLASESDMMEITVESEEETKYLTMPDQLRDKFVPLLFVPLCTKEKDENISVLVTPDIEEAAKQDRHARIEAALDRMRELQLYNEMSVLGRQKNRSEILERLFVDSQWNENLIEVLEARNEAIATEMLNRQLSAAKKKQDSKKK